MFAISRIEHNHLAIIKTRNADDAIMSRSHDATSFSQVDIGGFLIGVDPIKRVASAFSDAV